MDWEMIDGWHYRLKVPGGWVLKVLEDIFHYPGINDRGTGFDWRIAICFIPDPDHLWKVEKKNE